MNWRINDAEESNEAAVNWLFDEWHMLSLMLMSKLRRSLEGILNKPAAGFFISRIKQTSDSE